MAVPQVIGVSTLPNQKHKIISRKGTNFTLMVVGTCFPPLTQIDYNKPLNTGESGLGKTTFINTLYTTLLKDKKIQDNRYSKQLEKTIEIDISRFGTPFTVDP